MENMRFKVGDRVRIKSLDWYNENKDEYGTIIFSTESGDYSFIKEDTRFCGRVVTITYARNGHYFIAEDDRGYFWIDEMIEGLVEEEVDLIPKFGEYSDNEPLDVPTMTTEFIKEHGLPCPNGYIFKDENGNVINATKIVLEKKKKEYPKTYEECCKVLGLSEFEYNHTGTKVWYRHKLMATLDKLMLCRDAYWKLYGEEMGLGKPWEPDWREKRYIIYRNQDDIIGGYREAGCVEHHIFEFPTKEIRDAFYENFKELIESVKELL